MTKGRGRKLKGKGKKTTSQPDADSRVVPPALVPLSETPQAHALLGKRKAKNKWNYLSGFIFMCNARTKPECYRNRVFGLPAGRREDVEKVKKGMKLFLFDFDMKLLYGVYVATSNGQMNLEPSAFGGRFPAQVSFAIHKECLPLRETAFKFAIRENYEGSKFKAELTRRQVKDLLLLFPALTAASVAPIPQAIRVPELADQLQPSVMLPPSQDLYLAGAQPVYAAPIVEPRSVQRRVLNDPYYYAEIQRPYLAEDTAQDLYSRCVWPQQTSPPDQFAGIAAGYYSTYSTIAPQRENVAGYYTYPIPPTSLGPPLLHHPHGEREIDLQRVDVEGYYPTYPIPATSHGPPVMHPHGQVPGMPELPVRSSSVSSNCRFDVANQVSR